MRLESSVCCNTLKEIFKLYHDAGRMTTTQIINNIEKYLNKYACNYTLIDTDNCTEEWSNPFIKDGFYIIPLYDLLSLFIERFSCDDDILYVIGWYLRKYQPSYKLKTKEKYNEKLVLSSYYGVMLNP